MKRSLHHLARLIIALVLTAGGAAATLTMTTAGIVSAASCGATVPPGVVWQSSYPPERYGSTSEPGGYTITNDVWGDNPGPQTVWANSASNWGAIANIPFTPGTPQTFPDIYSEPGGTLNSYAALTGTSSEASPAGSNDHNEAAYDIWLNGVRGFEVMIWTDTHNVSPDPATDKGAVTIDGVQYEAYAGGVSGPGGSMTTLVQKTNTASQTVNIKDALNFLASRGWAPSNPVVSQVDYGFEIWGTNGCTEAFNVTNYSLSTSVQSNPAGPITSANNTSKCVDDRVNSGANGAIVQLWDCLGNANQQWTVNTDGTITHNGLCLDVTGQGTANGTGTELWQCNGGANQRWLQASAGGSLVSQQSGKCLDDPGWNTANGTLLDIWSCDGGANQRWNLP